MSLRISQWLIGAAIAFGVSVPFVAWSQEKDTPAPAPRLREAPAPNEPAPPPGTRPRAGEGTREGDAPRGKPDGRPQGGPGQPRRAEGGADFNQLPAGFDGPGGPMPPRGGRPGEPGNGPQGPGRGGPNGPGGGGFPPLGGGGFPPGAGGVHGGMGRPGPGAGMPGAGMAPGMGTPGMAGVMGGRGGMDWEQLRRDDPEMFELMKSDQDMERQEFELSEQLRQSKGEPRDALKKQIQELVQKHFDVRQKRRQLNLTRIEQDVQRMRDELKRREDSREAIVKRRTLELVGDHDELDF